MITGPVGVGKSTVLGEAARLLREAGVPGASLDLQDVEGVWPPPPDDPWNERISHRNLASVWANFKAAGADRLLLARVLEARSLMWRIRVAVPGAAISVVRLRAPADVLAQRIRHREAGRDPTWYLGAAAYLVRSMERREVGDYVIDTSGRSPADVAQEALTLTGWLPKRE